ncbi:MAG TPA: hypothetical protein PL044_03200 [Clostridiales bacterium]|nr:MAG: hypothetical protein BWY37_02037 [Firmicutes bacterium ADurb.Bin262]HOU10567.1 hypothetical protein [Clostridiales bacterium]HQH63466.1 hypothetical protein [Clostridiales bacterium]HQK72769.1 hypothetical protein [Clostridiales bacterium]
MLSADKIRLLKKSCWLILHTVIIVNFVAEILYGFYQVFFVLVPPGGKKGPLMGRAGEIPFELMVKRRLFATETWIAISGLAVYLAVIYKEKFKGFSRHGR